LEPSVIDILKPLAGAGPVMNISSSYFHTRRQALAALMKIKLPEYCCRNNYATYAQNFSFPRGRSRAGNTTGIATVTPLAER